MKKQFIPSLQPQKTKPSLKPVEAQIPIPDHPVQNNTDAERILQLQHFIGNQQVMRVLDTSPITHTNGSVIQRAPGDFGLKAKTSTSGFVSDAVDFWKKSDNKDKSLDAYATFLVDKVNSMLTAQCTTQFITSGGDSGSFSRTTWLIKINTGKFSENTSTTTVGGLTADEAAEVADTIYHEARHSEQYFTAAQIMAGEGKDAAAIVTAMGIPAEISEKAVANPIKADKKNKDMIAAVKDWEKIGSGVHSKYKGLVNTFMDVTENVRKDVGNVDTSTLAQKTTGLDTTIAGWKDTELKSFNAELKRIEDMKDKSKGDKLVLSHTKKIVKLTQAVVDMWEKDKVRSVKTVQKLAAKIRALEMEAYEAYRDHLHEKDAWAVGGAAGSQFRKLAKKK